MPWITVILEKLTVVQVVQNFSVFYDTRMYEYITVFTQETLSSHYAEPKETSQHSPTLFVKDPFQYYSLIYA